MTQWRISPQSTGYIRLTTKIVGLFGGKMRYLKALNELEYEIYRAA